MTTTKLGKSKKMVTGSEKHPTTMAEIRDFCCCRIHIGADCSRVVKTGFTNPNQLTEVLNGQVRNGKEFMMNFNSEKTLVCRR